MRSITTILGAVLAILTAQGQCFPAAATSPDREEITSGEFAARRDALATRIRDGVVVAFGGRRPVNDFSGFFQLPSFYYLTNFEEPDAVFVMVVRQGKGTSTLFVASPSWIEQDFYGWGLQKPTVLEHLLGMAVRPLSELEATLTSLSSSKIPFYVVPDFEDADYAGIDTLTRGSVFMREFVARHRRVVIKDGRQIVEQLRAKRSPAEMALLRRAAAITSEAYGVVMRGPIPRHEYEVAALWEYTFKRLGAARPGFASIVGAGANGMILHYSKDSAEIAPGDLIMIDGGAEYKHYASDMARTIPVSGTYSPTQRQIYQLVRDAQTAAEQVAKPGVPWKVLTDAAFAVRARGLAALGLIESADATYDPGQATDCRKEPRSCQQANFWMIHDISHGVGLAVHDVRHEVISSGDVFVIEPGVYISLPRLESLPDTPKNRAFVAKVKTAVSKYDNTFARIEDEYAVTESGIERISPAPREINEIEKLMRDRPGVPAP